MKFALALIAFVLVALVVPFLLPNNARQQGVNPESNLPWQIALDGRGGSEVFGLKPGVSTLADVKQHLGSELEVAIIAEPNEAGMLEAYYAQVPLGFVLARVIVSVDASREAVLAMRERALKSQHMESTTRKITLHPDDLLVADQMPIRAIAVIPTVNLDEATLVQRFGAPDERIVVSEKRVHLLYSKQGLDILVDGEGKELLQYVAPRDFSRLREPLVAAQSDKTASQ
ncbi:MAG: hypothetical protein D3M94_08595 [Rhodocyclales bacterium GT-UBC]|nr:MAG: hypothetical protein D3M94_08595 [Rhodocyclales bacterium GT-UBC]